LLDRLRPWIRRDLQVILEVTEAELVLRVVEALLKRYHPTSQMFMNEMYPYLHEATELFAHELVAFARSPFSVAGYDSSIEYDEVRIPIALESGHERS